MRHVLGRCSLVLTTNLGALVCRCRFGVEFPFIKSSIEQVSARSQFCEGKIALTSARGWRRRFMFLKQCGRPPMLITLLNFYSDLNLFAFRSIAHCASNVLRTISMRVVKAENDHLQLHMLH